MSRISFRRPDDPRADGDDAATVRELAWFVAATDFEPRDELTDDAMAAIVGEPLPAPITAAAVAARARRFGATFAALRDLWPVAWSGPRPFAVRATAIALVGMLVLGAGSAGSLVAVGAWNAMVPRPSPVVVPQVSPGPTPSPRPATPSPSVTPAPLPSPSPMRSSGPAVEATPSASQRPGGTVPRPSPTSVHTETHHPEMTHMPYETHAPSWTQDPWSSGWP